MFLNSSSFSQLYAKSFITADLLKRKSIVVKLKMVKRKYFIFSGAL